jgi:cellulose synthase/poly-beta-1,6-N-acetylglucosamine synthase-like glycosyltransferase
MQNQAVKFPIKNNYLEIGKASDLKDLKDRLIYRSFEILPGAVSWCILLFVVLFSWRGPIYAAVFIICFDLYWLFRTAYFAFHLRGGYRKMREYQNTDWQEKIKDLRPKSINTRNKDWKDLWQLVILPIYKEPLEIVRESFKSLAETDWPKDKMIVVLGCEERAKKETKETVAVIEKEFGKKFFKLLVTWHPGNLEGEIAGHGSNDAWASKRVKLEVIDPLKIPYEQIIISFFDADTFVFPGYFSCLAWHYLTAKKPTRTSYQPVPLYLNNIWDATPFSRVFAFSSTFWHTMNQERPEKLITFSSHSMSFQALVDVGFKQTNVVSDDSRIFWQCFFKYNGDYSVTPLYYPLSMDANSAPNIFRTALNIYRQQRRWAYGVAEIPYFLFGFLKNKKIPIKKKFSLGFELIEGHISWAVASILIFCLGWLPLLFGGVAFSQTILSYNLPRITSRILTISMSGLIISAYVSLLLLPSRPKGDRKFNYLIFTLSWVLVPIITVFFTALPALDAQTRLLLGRYMGFWPTEKSRK